jgi:hypothetical protein
VCACVADRRATSFAGGKFLFEFNVPKDYPHTAPKVQCKTTVFHPNLDMEGHVCLNILREDWKPVLTIQSIVMGLQFLMLEPNADDPLNKEAANLLAENPRCRNAHPVHAPWALRRASSSAGMFCRARRKFEATVRETFKGRQMQVGSQRYMFPRFE